MKKILCFVESLVSGGAERQMVNVAKLLKDEGYDVSFVCYARGDFYAPILEKEGISIHWEVANNYIERMLRIRKFIRKGGYDAVISFLDVPNFLNDFAALGGKKWKVITGERSAKTENFFSPRGKVFAWFQRYSDHVVCNSINAQRMWLQYYPQYKDKLTTIYNVVGLDPVNSEYKIRRDGRLHIVVVASYQHLKNPIGLMRALSLMSEAQKDLLRVDWYGRVEYVKGDSRAYEETVEFIEKYHLHDLVHLHAATNDISTKINEADVVGLFSRLEGLSNAICEAMTLGKPVVMSKVSDYSTLIDSSNGFLCDWDHPESIKEAILSVALLTNEQLSEMGKASRIKAAKLFSREKIAKQWTSMLG